MQPTLFSSLAQIYPPQTEISKGVEEELEIPKPKTLQGKYLITQEEKCSSMYKMILIWCRNFPLKSVELDEYVECLKQNPYFLEVWEDINREQKIKFHLIAEEEAKKKEDYDADAWYSPHNHTITLVNCLHRVKISVAIIFECCNAFHRQERGKALSSIGWDNIPNRNMYGVFREQLEHQTSITYNEIVQHGVAKLEWLPLFLRDHDPETGNVLSFEKKYPRQNVLNAGKEVTHTEKYRLFWDQKYASTFFLKHSEELEKHPELIELST